MNMLSLLFLPWRVFVAVVLVCGAVVPGPCTFDAHPEFDCNLADVCDRNFACATDGYCKSADIACLDGEVRCEYPGLPRVGVCVAEESFASSKTHCGGCFQRCLGAGVCEQGTCQGAPAPNVCDVRRGNFDCEQDQACVVEAGTTGRCTGRPGKASTFSACTEDSDCAGGMCQDDVCVRPCDFGCPVGMTCDEDEAVPGGRCRPDGTEVCGS